LQCSRPFSIPASLRVSDLAEPALEDGVMFRSCHDIALGMTGNSAGREHVERGRPIPSGVPPMDRIRNCLEKIAHCLNKGGPHAAPDHIRLMQDCVQICRASAEVYHRCREGRFDVALAA
jgi:hypothetical protein